MRKEIVVVTTTDAEYLLNCYVSIYSMIKTASSEHIYRIFVLVTDVSGEDCKKLEDLSLEYVFVKCINVAEIINDFDLRETEQFPVSIYYRLFIPLILPEYRKVLYLDADTCALRDIAELYEYDLDGCVMGAVHDIPCEHLETHDEEIGGLDCRKTFNSGVLLIDIEAFEREQIRKKCLALLSEDYERTERRLIYPDNDALNLILYDKYKVLDDAWNFQVQYMWKLDEIFEGYRDNYKKASCQPYLLHYTGKYKPWTDPDRPMADVFWRIAGETSVYNEIIFKLLVEARNLRENIEYCKLFTFPFSQIPHGSKIAVYAAGKVGQAFYFLMQISHYAEIVLWVDQNYEKITFSYPIKSPRQLFLRREEYDYLIIAIENKEIADEVLDKLYLQGIPRKKLIWSQYKQRR